MDDDTVVLSLRVPPDLMDELKQAAAQDERTVSSLVRWLLREGLTRTSRAAE